jgi:hypothetical protein
MVIGSQAAVPVCQPRIKILACNPIEVLNEVSGSAVTKQKVDSRNC